ncbi:MAG: FAD-dependent oxidoreductase [Elusimicrobia bacterium]|nr:FAD-dependent oxidoreductase [Elusimicrobiota bacterium]
MKSSDRFSRMEEKGFDLSQAVAEAGRCLLCHEPPCSKGCPAGTDPGAFIRKLRFRNITGAIRTVKKNNILGGACGVLCPTARLCEKECCATGIDRPIRIGKLQRFLIEHSWKIGFKPFDADASERPPRRKEKVAVVGAGPAGLSCAAELAANGFQVTVFEARPEPGGVLRYGVPGFRFQTEFLKKEIDDLLSLGVELKCSTPMTGDGAAEKLLQQGYRAVFLATGLWKPVRLKKDQRDLKGLFTSMEFLSALREGKAGELSKSIKGKVCAVIGGGSVAMDCARSAVRLGAADVYLLYRRSLAQMPAEEDERTETMNEGVHFLTLNQPLGFLADSKGKLKGVKLIRTTLGARDSSGRRKPVEVKGTGWSLPPVPSARSAYPSLKLERGGLIRAGEKDCRTSLRGGFAGGDIVRGPDLVVRAVRDGKTAARSIMSMLDQKAGA